jgi:hypothetical protein
VDKFENMYSLKAGEKLNGDLMKNYIKHIENARYFMPPFLAMRRSLALWSNISNIFRKMEHLLTIRQR